ncbi:flavohemoprotein [Shewanella algicola]|uniref:nitric oxide dioxygenase n=1 Tax=Shewanella algicola TaxID=640633 RepID=A0A9X2CCS9_9GAMM|nr:NO-inducible flavohemoprotein [Shewanella algicola]MCL1104711.1 NO-inducible flavohemoprotein [Shewanella algicola]GGP45110.1 flavohemoprotein [Shewanella algicola]
MLDTATVQIIKATVPALQIYANDITSHFYPLLFSQHPEVLPYFNQTNQGKGTQPKALANAVIAYGANIDELGNLSDAVSKIVQKHTALGILPEQYDAVGSCLLQAIKAVLGDAATDEVIGAWAKAYGQLANILIAAEESVYTANEQKEGGWRGEREFILVKRENESSVITSFYFQPFDNQGLPDFEAGQFLTILFDDIDGVAVRRNYSLSDAAGKDYLRISVKREPNGVVSNHLHNNIQLGDKVKLRAPSGDFTLRKNAKPLVLLTGGVGITPAISMLNTAVGSGRDIRFIHAAINSDVHAFKQHVDTLAAANSNITPLYIYSQPQAHCQPHATGFIDASFIEAQLPADRDVELYVLGPIGFMKAALAIATSLGIPSTQIHYEFFGPAESLTA